MLRRHHCSTMADQDKLERKALEKFRPLAINLCLHEEDMHDKNLLKWLRARNNNVEEAAVMLLKAMNWRSLKRMDRILAWEAPAQFQLDFAYDMNGEDKQGCPVFVIPLGKWDIRKAYHRGQKKILHKYMEQMLERGIERTRWKNITDPADTFINQCVYIWDLEGLTMKQMTSTGMMDTLMDFAKTVEAIYPGIVKRSFAINVPKFFPLLFAMIKPILSPLTLDKIQIFGTNANKWKPVLRKYISEDQLPEHYGGTCRVDENLLRIKNNRLSISDEEDDPCKKGMFTVTVEPEEKIQIAVDVLHPNSILRWKFFTEDDDISFHLIFSDQNQTLVSECRVDSHLDLQEGSYKAHIPGRCKLEETTYV